MIVRQNWLDVNSYLDYHENTLLCSEKTIQRKRNYLRHLLEWPMPPRFRYLMPSSLFFPPIC